MFYFSTPENVRKPLVFFDDFRRYRNGTLTGNGLNVVRKTA